jgi:branched-chain amino acid transport system substrate-binding protein
MTYINPLLSRYLKNLTRAMGVLALLSALDGCNTTSEDHQQSQIVTETLAPPQQDQAQSEVSKSPRAASMKVAVLLPLSGSYKEIGETLTKAIEIGFFQSNQTVFSLVPKDTKGTPEGATAALREALALGKVDLVLGPLTAGEVKAIKPLAMEKRVPIISFSNVTEVAGENVFIMGFSPREQMKSVVAYAIKNKVRHFVALISSDEFSRQALEGIREATEANTNVQLKSIVAYNANGTDLEEKIRILDLKDVEGLIVPEGGDKLLKIVNLLTQNDSFNKAKPRLIGSGQWDDEKLFVDISLDGAWFPSPHTETDNPLVASFEKQYGYRPPRISSLGFDAMVVAQAVAASSASTTETLTRYEGFRSLGGIFSFNNQGQIQREWAVYEIVPYKTPNITLIGPGV